MKNKLKIKKLELLKELADFLETQIDSVVAEAYKITKEKQEDGFTWDWIRNGYGSPEELLERFNGKDKTSTIK